MELSSKLLGTIPIEGFITKLMLCWSNFNSVDWTEIDWVSTFPPAPTPRKALAKLLVFMTPSLTGWKVAYNGRWPQEEDDLWLKMTFDWKQIPMEDDLQWKTIYNGRQTTIEDNLQLNITYNGRQPLKENNFWLKTTFDGRWLSMEDNTHP